MEATIHPDLVDFIREQVDSGQYRSPDEVLTEALFLLWQRDRLPAGERSHSRCDAA